VNELFWPSETSDSAGDTLIGTMTADRASGPPVPASYESVLPVQPQGQAAPRPDPVASLGQFQAAQQAQKGQEAPPFKSITMKADGTFKMEGDQSMLAEVMGQLTDLKTMKTAAMARVAELRQQEASGSPLLDALSTFSGNMAANDPTLPGWVRALGATNLQMGPQGIRARREAEEQKALQLTKLTADTALDAAKLEGEREKMWASISMKAQQDAAKAEKDAMAAAFRLRGAGLTQIKASGEYDVEGMVEEMRSHSVPEEMIRAQVESLSQFKEAYNQKKAEEAAEKDEVRRQERREELSDMERRFAERNNAMITTLGAAFGWKSTQAAMPKKPDVDMVTSAGGVLHSLDGIEEFLGNSKSKYKGGPLRGLIAANNPWRDPDMMKARFDAYSLTLAALKVSGLAPISQIEFSNQEKQVANPNLTWDQGQKLVKSMRDALDRGLRQYIEMRPEVNWDLAKDSLPKSVHDVLPKMKKRREEIYGAAAPDFSRIGGGRSGLPSLPEGWSVEEVP
jgi:hypothetical protein